MDLSNYIDAGFAGLWIETSEHDEAIADIAATAQKENWRVRVWDCANGFHDSGGDKDNPRIPLAALREMANGNDGHKIVVLPNYHRFLGKTDVLQDLANTLGWAKGEKAHVVVLSPLVQIPVEVEKLFTVLDYDLPTADQLFDLGHRLEVGNGVQPTLTVETAAAASGLTRREAENAFSLSLVRHEEIQPEEVWAHKAQALRKTGHLALHRGKESVDNLAGLDALHDFCSRSLASKRARPKGVLLLGVPGSGKSAYAKALGNATCRPVLHLDIGALMGGIVGQTESNIRAALKTADAMAPAVLFVDEIEKALGGASNSDRNDGGVGSRLFGTLLTWLSDHETDVFFLGTANAVDRLPPEFSRAERFDGIFFLDLPTVEAKRAIWDIYRKQFGILEKQKTPDDEKWTGAEIRACCRLAAMHDVTLEEASRYVVPVAVTAPEKVTALRQWADGRCLDAAVGGVYRTNKPVLSNKTRKVVG